MKILLLFSFLLCACASNPPATGTTIPAFLKVESSIYRGGQPQSLSDYQYLKSIGIRTVIKLNDEKLLDEEAWAATTNIDLMPIPLSGIFEPSDGDMNEIESLLADSTDQPLFIHCLHGEDRTGLAIGLYRVKHEHWDTSRAYDEMKANHFHTLLVGLDHYFWENAK